MNFKNSNRKSNRSLYEQKLSKEEGSKSSSSLSHNGGVIRPNSDLAAHREGSSPQTSAFSGTSQARKERPQGGSSASRVRSNGNRTRYANKAERRRARRRKTILKAIALVCLILIICGVTYGVYRLVGEPQTRSQGDSPVAGSAVDSGPLHGYFVLGSEKGFLITNDEEEPIALNGGTLDRGGVVMAPLSGVAETLSLEVEKSGDSYTITRGDKTLSVVPEQSEAQLGEKSVTLSYAPFYQGEELYVPVQAVSESLGLKAEYTEETYRLDVYSPEGLTPKPRADFLTDKDVYAPGEKISYAIAAGGNKPHSIVAWQWENKQERYFSAGKETVVLKVKDYQGNWSEPISKEITIAGDAYVPAERTPVLMYHYLVDNDAEVSVGGKEYNNAAVMSVNQFKRQMEYIKNNGYQTIYVSEFLSYLSHGTLPPPKSVVVIFDDGYENNYTLAYPILKDLGLKANIAVIFKNSIKKSDDPNYQETITPRLTMSEIEEMQASGVFEIGSHSYAGHSPEDKYEAKEGYYLAQPAYNKELCRQETEAEFENRLEDDAFKAKEILRQRLGVENPFFVYPYGRISDMLIKKIKNSGFTSGFIIGEAYAQANTDLYKIPRFTIKTNTTDTEFASIISGQGLLPPPAPKPPAPTTPEPTE